MRDPLVYRGALLACSLLLLAGFCFCSEASQTEISVSVAGIGKCIDCTQKNIQTNHAFSGLYVAINCKAGDKGLKTRAIGELDQTGNFDVKLPTELLNDKGELKEDCFALLHNGANTPCPDQNQQAPLKIVLKSKENGKHVFSTAGTLAFSPLTCTSAFLWPNFKHHPLPKLPPFSNFKPLYKPMPKFPPTTSLPFVYKPLPPLPPKTFHPIYKKPLPPIVFPPIHKYPLPPVPMYKKPLPPPLPIYQKPLLPPIPVYKKPLPPPIPIYKKPLLPQIPIYKKPLPPTIPIYKKPLPPPIYIKPLPPMPKLPPIYKKPLYPIPKLPPIYKKPLHPIPKFPPIYMKPFTPLPPLGLPPKYSFKHPKFGWPPLQTFPPHPSP